MFMTREGPDSSLFLTTLPLPAALPFLRTQAGASLPLGYAAICASSSPSSLRSSSRTTIGMGARL
jgi:hypothetical protein